MYLLFVVPNSWAETLDRLNLTMVPLLKKAGVVFPEDVSEKLIYITQLDAGLSNFQLHSYFTKQAPQFFTQEGSGMMYDIHIDETSICLNATSYQLQEDRGLRLFGERHYTPEIDHVDTSERFNSVDLEGVKDALEEVVFKNIFDLGHLMHDTAVPDDCSEYKTVAACILGDILMNIRVSVLCVCVCFLTFRILGCV
jgi:hypothetical protein